MVCRSSLFRWSMISLELRRGSLGAGEMVPIARLTVSHLLIQVRFSNKLISALGEMMTIDRIM
jgi:hypothetical protein